MSKPPKPDKIDKAQLAKDYGYALNIIYGIPTLSSLFQEAVTGGWSAARFQKELMSSDWYKNNNQYARAYLTAKAAGGADFEAMQQTARTKVQSVAAQVGRELTETELESLSQQYMSQGWGDADRAGMLEKTLAAGITLPPSGILSGQSGNLQQQLKATAELNGLKYSDSFYLSAAKSVASGLTTAEDWDRDIRQQAASMYPAWSDKINAGMNINDLASGYMTKMAQTLEVDPNSINLNDPYLRQALGSKDPQGNPTMMSMWEFEQKLRQDPRFMNTKQAQDEMFSTANGILQMFGMAG